ncbi:MAG: hypothetical protein R3B06_26480 [Kofleriaceae bacterium]
MHTLAAFVLTSTTLVACAARSAPAPGTAPAPGESEVGLVPAGTFVKASAERPELVVTVDVGGARTFAIDLEREDGRLCRLDGTLTGTGFDGAGGTRVELTPADGGAVVTVRGSDLGGEPDCDDELLSGTYLAVTPACGSEARDLAYEGFTTAYQARRYADALRAIDGLVACGDTLSMPTRWGYRNDRAVTLYHLGQLAACRAALDGLPTELGDPEAAERPAQEVEARLAKATATNLALCAGAPR